MEEVKASLEERKQNRISEFEFYPVNNNDVNTKNALVLTSGDYAILVICDNYEEAQKFWTSILPSKNGAVSPRFLLYGVGRCCSLFGHGGSLSGEKE